ncbi:GH25 family lysozyme [Lacticaseibacillus yichunensis]|uniref:GH25 family lysozyme n=1 Tax=Lacticaseibacillus yichunensis TaxID=2486015 RepID=A0ABW4CTY5_9LACO|nr:GH25 family lysozyme [Lacticaseibacillus yichunensis]
MTDNVIKRAAKPPVRLRDSRPLTSTVLAVSMLGGAVLGTSQTQQAHAEDAVPAAQQVAQQSGSPLAGNKIQLTPTPTEATVASGTVINSHSNLTPANSFAYVIQDNGDAQAAEKVTLTPFSDDAKVDTILEPAGLTPAQSDSWLVKAKAAATEDYLKTGREQKIVRLAATVPTIIIGSTSIPAVSAIDVSSYQSWMKQSDYNQLKKLGVNAVVVKTTESTTYLNPAASNQIKYAKAAGMHVSVYHYAHFTTNSEAVSEAKQTAAGLVKLGLAKNTLIFADMEEPDTIFISGVQANLNQYWTTLRSLGYTNFGLYTSAGYSSTAAMVATVGEARTWVADYPINPSKNSMLHDNYGAWQFASDGRLSSASPDNQVLDISHDYNGLLVGTYDGKPLETAINYGKYVTVTSSKGSIWWNFAWDEREKVASYTDQTLYAKYIYYTSNGSTYYSLYDRDGQSVGYINTALTKTADGSQGIGFGLDKYVRVTSSTSTAWANFTGTALSSTKSLYQRTYHARYMFKAFNGGTYYSLYTENNKWVGYVNSVLTADVAGPQGSAFEYGRYVTVATANGALWKSFDWVKSANSSSFYRDTLYAKYIYHHANGSDYLSLYNGNGTWVGYINSASVDLATGPWGTGTDFNRYVTVTKDSGSIWSSFNWVKKIAMADVYGQTYRARYVYHHYNGSDYYALYDKNGKFAGYINSACTTEANGPYGTGVKFDKRVTITGENGTVWSSFNWIAKATTRSLVGDSFIAKYAYGHYNESTYYSLYDDDGNWFGYINSSLTTRP